MRTPDPKRHQATTAALETGSTAGATPPPEALTRVGRYPVLGVLGSGGMGEVLEVLDPDLNREVALKLIHPATLSDRSIQRFILEAQVTGQLQHPNIVPLYELGKDAGGRPFFTLKRVVGRTLETILAEERTSGVRWPEGEARRLETMIKLCDAMSYAHARGVIHRDLKPANAMCGAFGEVLVMDWGLAKVAPGADPNDVGVTLDLPAWAADAAPLATLDGAVCGTPAYMSPEQADGALDRIDARTDVYALGAILYEMLTLEPPAEGPTAWAVIAQVTSGQIAPPRARAPDRGIPPELESVVVRAMAMDPLDRYASVAELAEDLRAYVDGRLLSAARYSLSARCAKWARRRRGPLLAAAASLAVAVVVGGLLVRRAGHERDDRVARVLARASAAGEGLPDSAALRRAFSSFDTEDLVSRVALENRRTEWQRHLSGYLRRASELDRALVLDPTRNGLVDRRVAAGEDLAMGALLAGELTLARQAFADLSRWGVDESVVERWVLHVDQVGSTLARWQKRNLLRMLADLEQGLASRDRHFPEWTSDDYAFEASSYRDAQTADVLGEALDAMGRELSHRPPTQAERVRVSFCCVVLGRLALEFSVPPLARWSAQARDSDQVVEVGLALCRTGRPEAYPVLLQLRARQHPDSDAWARVRRALHLVPEPSGSRAGEAPSVALHIERGVSRHERGDFVGALADFGEALRLDPRNAGAFMARGNTYKLQGEYALALADFDEAIRLDPTRWQSYFNRSIVREFTADDAGALADIDHALRLAPGVSMSHVSRGRIKRRAGDLDAALESFSAAAAANPRDHNALLNRAQVRRVRGDLVGATSDYREASRLDPENAACLVLLADLLRTLGEAVEATALIETAIRIDARFAAAFVVRASLKEARGDLPSALVDLDHALALDEGNAAALCARAHLHSRMGVPAHARLDIERAVELAPKDAQMWIVMGQVCRTAKDYACAIAACERAIELGGAGGRAYFDRGLCRAEMGDRAAAEADYGYAITLNPLYGAAYHNRGVLRYERGDLEGALSDTDRAIALEPTLWQAMYQRGKTLAAQNRLAEAIACLRRSRSAAPSSTHAAIDAEIALWVGRSKGR